MNTEMKAAEFRNESGLTFTDISSELYREYTFPNDKRIYTDNGYVDVVKVRVYLPLKLNVSDSGGHRIFDKSGKSHYIPKGWVHLEWEASAGSPHFVK